MNNIKLFIKGILIGVGKIIPGVSGSMIAISLGLYDKIINSLSNIFKNFKENIVFLFQIGLGISIAIVFISKLIVYDLNNHYFSTMLLFIGFIVGGLPSIIKKAKQEINIKNAIILVIPFILFLIIDILTNNVNINVNLTNLNVIWLGFIEAISMIIPGLSGTSIMIMLGVYEEILMMFSQFEYIYKLTLFIIGIMIGIFSLCKIINYILNRYEISCYYAIIGFVTSSIIIMLRQLIYIRVSLLQITVGIILFMIGLFVSYKLE